MKKLSEVIFVLIFTFLSCTGEKSLPENDLDEVGTDFDISDEDIEDSEHNDPESDGSTDTDEEADNDVSGVITISKIPSDVVPDKPSYPYSFAKTKNGILFFAANDATGIEPWISDGTETGTKLLFDTCPGKMDSNSKLIHSDSIQAIFYACGLFWISDGTIEGTTVISNSEDKSLSFFARNEPELLPEGIQIGETVLVLFPMYEISIYDDLVWEIILIDKKSKTFKKVAKIDMFQKILGIKDSKVFFLAGNNDAKLHLWSSDGTEENTAPVVEISPFNENESWYLVDLTMKEKFVFMLSDGYETKFKFVVTDGTASGTELFEKVSADYEGFISIEATDANFYVSDYNGNFFHFDPSTGELDTVANLANDFSAGIYDMIAFEDSVFLLVSIDDYFEILKFDEKSNEFSSFHKYNEPVNSDNILPLFFKKDSTLCFVDNEKFKIFSSYQSYTDVLNIYDAAKDTTRKIKLNSPFFWEDDFHMRDRPRNFDFIGSDIFFGGNEIIVPTSDSWYHAGNEPKIILRESTEAELLKNINHEVLSDYYAIYSPFLYDNILYYSTPNVSSGHPELNITDRGVNRTEKTMDIDVDDFIVFKESLYVNSMDGIYLVDHESESLFTYVADWAISIFPLKDFILFSSSDTEHGQELWKTNGTENGTEFFKDIFPGKEGSFPPEEFIAKDNKMLFRAKNSEETGWEPYFTDGTPENTKLLADAIEGERSSDMFLMQLLDDYFYFVAYNELSDISRIYRTDGIELKLIGDIDMPTEGFVRIMVPLKDKITVITNTYNESFVYSIDHKTTEFTKILSIPARSVNQEAFARIDNKVLFLLQINGPGRQCELWITDGTATGTQKIKSLFQDLAKPYNYKNYMFNSGGQVFFSISDGIHGDEVWISDGTETGTKMLKDIMPGQGQSNPVFLLEHKEILYFTASDGVHGNELWRTDGTTEGTYMVYDLFEGPDSSSISSIFFTDNDDIVVKSYDEKDGYQLRKIPAELCN